MKSSKEHEELERLVGRELRQLRDVRAPGTLLHRVMLAVHERERRPWWKRAWPEWPRELQVISLAALAALAGGLFAGTTGLITSADLTPLTARLHNLAGSWSEAGGLLQTLANATVLVAKTAGRPVLIGGAVIVGAGYLLSVGVLTTCYRFATQRV